MKTNKAILGLATGLAVGTTLGILFAPDKGEKTRKKIASKTKEAKDKLKENFNGIVDSVAEKYETIKQNGEELFKNEKENLKQNAKKVVEKA